MPTSSPLPGSLRVDFDKVAFYLLNAAHQDGGPKARFFLSLGFSTAEPLPFVIALVEHARTHGPGTMRDTDHGRRFIIEGPMSTPTGSTDRMVRTVWQSQPHEPFARLVTAYPI